MNLTYTIIKSGFEGKEFTYFVSITKGFLSTQFPSDKEVIIPETYKGYPVTHLGYVQDKTLAHIRDHDYHHPSQGGDYYPTEYYPRADLFGPEFPETLKRFFIPKTIKEISYNFFEKMKDAPNLIIEIDPENPYYQVINNQVIRKK